MTKENVTEMLLAIRVIIFVYEVPCICWHYINVDEVSLITLKKLLQSAMIITNCDSTTTKKLLANYASRENFKFDKLLY